MAHDYNLKIIKISLFFISFDLYFFINCIFFDNSAIHKIYEDAGNFNFSYFIPKIIYSFIISYYLFVIIKYFSLSERNLLELKNEEDEKKAQEKAEKIKKCLIIKYIIFYIISFIFNTFIWYYLSSFCAVYKNTQYLAIENTLISFGLFLLYPAFVNLLPCTLRMISLKNNESMNEYLYKISKFLQIF